MKALNAAVMAYLFTAILAVDASAGAISKELYKSEKDRIASDYKVGKEACDKLDGNPKDVCVAEVKGRSNVAEAELELRMNPTANSQYEVVIAKAEADYSVAKEQCDSQDGDAKDICKKVAKDNYSAAKANAKMQLGNETD